MAKTSADVPHRFEKSPANDTLFSIILRFVLCDRRRRKARFNKAFIQPYRDEMDMFSPPPPWSVGGHPPSFHSTAAGPANDPATDINALIPGPTRPKPVHDPTSEMIYAAETRFDVACAALREPDVSPMPIEPMTLPVPTPKPTQAKLTSVPMSRAPRVGHVVWNGPLNRHTYEGALYPVENVELPPWERERRGRCTSAWRDGVASVGAKLMANVPAAAGDRATDAGVRDPMLGAELMAEYNDACDDFDKADTDNGRSCAQMRLVYITDKLYEYLETGVPAGAWI